MELTEINPIYVHTGDTIISNKKKRTVQTVSFCPIQPEFVHLDKECYDTRFTTVILVTK